MKRWPRAMVGSSFGEWTVTDVLPGAAVRCICRCGTISVMCKNTKHTMVRGLSKSCGCLVPDAVRRAQTTHGHSKHGGGASSTYVSWKGVIQRCTNPNDIAWPDYGGRGIGICDRWRGEGGFENFLVDMGEKPVGTGKAGRALYSIDRIDNDKGYEPGNCKWSTVTEQNRNRRPLGDGARRRLQRSA